MPDDSVLSAADIARLAGVGRAAVSNWRKRYPDFPEPVPEAGGAPMFRSDDVQQWLREQGKLLEDSALDTLWQTIEANRGEQDPLEAVVTLAQYLAGQADADGLPDAVREVVDGLAATQPVGKLVESLCLQLFEPQQRQHLTTPPEMARLMGELAAPAGQAAFDPTCGSGTLLHVAAEHGARSVSGQESDPQLARLASARLALTTADSAVSPGDALRADAWSGLTADVVLCDPPFGYRDWGYEELGVDPRWEYGVPVKGEPELAWLQHALAHTKPGGTVVLAVPASVAYRRAGRTIRQSLVRHGVFRAVIALPAGVLRSTGAPIHLWVLRNPAGAGAEPVLLVDASDHRPRKRGQVNWSALREAVLEPWREFTGVGEVPGVPGKHQAIEPIELLDEEVDLTPARHLKQPDTEIDTGELNATAAALSEQLTGLGSLLPVLRRDTTQTRAMTTVSDLARVDALTVHRNVGTGQWDMDEAGAGPLVLTGRDVADGMAPTARLVSGEREGTFGLRPGDVVVPLLVAGDGRVSARVIEQPGVLLGPNLALIRVDPQRVDAQFLAGQLRTSGAARAGGTASGVHRFDVRRVEVPVLDIEQQRGMGDAFRTLAEFESGLARAHASGVGLARQLGDALASGVGGPELPEASGGNG